MRALIIAAAVLAGAACAELRSGYVKVEFLEGRVPATGACTFKVNAEGGIEAICTALNDVETDLTWKREKKRAEGGQL